MKYTTSTINAQNEIVPWLAAKDALAYTPFSPPEKDYFFLYNFILPTIFSEKVNRRRRHWFGDDAGKSDFQVQLLRNFWADARNGNIMPVLVRNSLANFENDEAPIALFKINCFSMGQSSPHYLFIQHGSYLFIPIRKQPLLESGSVLLHRGIGKSNIYHFYQMPTESCLLNRYKIDLSNSFSDSVTSFIAAHASVRRTETSHLLDSVGYFWLSHLSDNTDDAYESLVRAIGQCTL